MRIILIIPDRGSIIITSLLFHARMSVCLQQRSLCVFFVRVLKQHQRAGYLIVKDPRRRFLVGTKVLLLHF